MSIVFRWVMRHGAKLLFAFALVQFLAGLIPLIATVFSETSHMAQHHGYSPDGNTGIPFALQFQLLFAAISSAAYPFFGALLIDRLDRWLDGKAKAEGDE